VSTAYLRAHPDVVSALVRANVEAIRLARQDPDRAREIVAEQLAAAGAPVLDPDVLEAAWSELTFTWDPLAPSLVRVAELAHAVGLWPDPPGDVDGVYRLDALNGVLNDEGLPPVEVPA
jgi:NitT/TauT family transport system substrate-binding protein